jgi:hypothetical protein
MRVQHLAAWTPLGLTGGVLFTIACGGGADEPLFIKSEDRSTRAIISVERSLSMDGPTDGVVAEATAPATQSDASGAAEATVPAAAIERGSAHAIAHFVSLPQYSQPDLVLDTLGLRRVWPAVDNCVEQQPGAEPETDLDLRSLGHLELLDAGEVAIETERASINLAPRAFPTVSQLVSGVTYTTRDQSLDPLPAALRYRFRTAGSTSLPALSLSAIAPESLRHVTVSGLPIEEIFTVPATAPLDVTWLPATQGNPSDLVVLELTSDVASHSVRCVFRDEAGVGTMPPELTKRMAGPGLLSVHRVRRAVELFRGSDQEIASTAQIDFDFVITRSVDVLTP